MNKKNEFTKSVCYFSVKLFCKFVKIRLSVTQNQKLKERRNAKVRGDSILSGRRE